MPSFFNPGRTLGGSGVTDTTMSDHYTRLNCSSLAQLARSFELSLSDLAFRCGVKTELLQNVDLHRQALPLPIASRIATVISSKADWLPVSQADVVHCVSRVCTAVSVDPKVGSILEDACVPLPPQFGDPVTGVRIVPTLPVTPP